MSRTERKKNKAKRPFRTPWLYILVPKRNEGGKLLKPRWCKRGAALAEMKDQLKKPKREE